MALQLAHRLLCRARKGVVVELQRTIAAPAASHGLMGKFVFIRRFTLRKRLLRKLQHAGQSWKSRALSEVHKTTDCSNDAQRHQNACCNCSRVGIRVLAICPRETVMAQANTLVGT